jgi:hypothetical protein
MNLTAIKGFLSRENPRFICRAGPGDDAGEPYVAHLEHRVTPPESDCSVVASVGLDDLTAFYGEFGSVRLYCDTNSSSSAFYLASPPEWDQLKKEFLRWIRMLGTDDRNQLPDWVENCVVFGEIPETGHYLMTPVEGSDSGKVYRFEHEGFLFEEIAADLGGFLDAITTPTEDLFRKIRTHTCYSDGETATQWLVVAYEDDA